MNKKDEIFKKVYFDSFLISEDTNKVGEEEKPQNSNGTSIDDLTKENIITIEDDTPVNENGNLETTKNNEDSSENNNEEFEDDGWGEEMVENLSPLLNDIEGFIYELKNCVRGSFTGCKTKEELRNYIIENLSARLTEAAEDL